VDNVQLPKLHECFDGYVTKDMVVNAITTKFPTTQGFFDFELDSRSIRIAEQYDTMEFILRAKLAPLYQRFKKTVNGKEREISLPKEPLKNFFTESLLPIILTTPAHKNCHGGEKGWSVLKSVQSHVPASYAFSFDIQNSGPTFPFDKVNALYQKLFAGVDDVEKISYFFALLSTVPYTNATNTTNTTRGLAVGSPISNAVFNRAMNDLDENLTHQAHTRNMKFTRWGDDYTVTSQTNMQLEDVLGALMRVHTEHPINMDKTHLQNVACGSIYILGHKINQSGQVTHNSTLERTQYKTPPLPKYVLETTNYPPW
jgi:hypothetical protein